jgi:hypothetical protein
MKEARIIAFIGIYASLILSNTSTGKIKPWLYIALAIFWLGRYIYLINRK